MNDTFKESPLVRYWQVLVVLGTMVFGGGSLFFQIGAMQNAVADNHLQIDKISEDKNALDRAIVEVKIRQEALVKAVEEIKQQQKEQDKKLDKILQEVSKD